jgi:hypothetical protein
MSVSAGPKPTAVHYGRWRTRLLSGTVVLGFTVLLWFGGEPGLGRWAGMVLLGAVGGFCLLPSETHFDSANRVIERRWRFLGLLTVFRRRLALAQFRQVCWKAVGSWDEAARSNLYAWKVGLESASGRRVYLNYFNAPATPVCEEARQFAIELSKLTGLPLSHEIDAG